MSTATRLSRDPHSIPVTAKTSPAAGLIFLFVFLGLAAAITFAYQDSFFGTAYYEEGDDAANAIQIARAKQFRELHGNYSRWTFNHPGPAFFYVYAAGEWLLHDLTRLAPAPRNAHIYTGTLLQIAFFAAAIALLARHVRQRLTIAALAVIAGALQFGRIEHEHSIYSVWPPDVIVMPFLCFVVAGAAVSLRNRAALPILVISGSFLVHGHIAQPLFVVPMTLLAMWLAWRPDVRGGVLGMGRDRPGRLSLVMLGLFLLPLCLDLFAGAESNARSILRHLRYESDAGQTLWQSVLCYVSYFIPLHDQTIFNTLSADSYAALRERAGVLALWGGVFAFAAWRLWRRPRGGEPEAKDIGFGRRLFVFWIAGSALTLIWGMRQDGGFTTFNSDFNHALVYVVALLAIIAVANRLPTPSRGFGWFVLAAAMPAFALALQFDPTVGSRGDEIEVRLQGLLKADPKADAPKLITWDLPGEDWYEAVTLARAFERRGLEFYVHPSWRFMFGADKVFDNAGDPLSRGAISPWHVVQRKRAPAGARVLNHEYAVVFPEMLKENSLPLRIDFGKNEHLAYHPFGIADAEEAWVWTEGNAAALFFNVPAASSDLELTIVAAAYVSKRTREGQRLNLRINGELVGRHRFGRERQRARFAIPRAVWSRQSPQIVVFELPDAVSPARAGKSADQRILGLSLYELTLVLEPLSRSFAPSRGGASLPLQSQ